MFPSADNLGFIQKSPLGQSGLSSGTRATDELSRQIICLQTKMKKERNYQKTIR
jgi:hypothetical protein